MAIHLYTLCWNEAAMLGFFFRHYNPWVDRYIVYDDASTDGSLELLRCHPKVEVRRFQRTCKDSFVLSHQVLHNEAWKESRGTADWVIVTAIDEHLHVKGRSMSDYLLDCTREGVTLVPALGYQMISEEYPDPGEWLCTSRTWGAPWSVMNKLSVFNPGAVVETGFVAGRHSAEPRGDLRLPARDELILLHYKYLNFDRTLQRHRELRHGMLDIDVARGFGFQYHWSAERLCEEWARLQAHAIDIGLPGFRPWRMHEPPRWWRPDGFLDEDSASQQPMTESTG